MLGDLSLLVLLSGLAAGVVALVSSGGQLVCWEQSS